jgi:hypothetical protein
MLADSHLEANGIPFIINRHLLNLASKVRIEVALVAGVRFNPKKQYVGI